MVYLYGYLLAPLSRLVSMINSEMLIFFCFFPPHFFPPCPRLMKQIRRQLK